MVRFGDYLKHTSEKIGDQENGVAASLSVENFKPEQKKKPTLTLWPAGERSLLSGNADFRIPLTFSCIQRLMLEALLGAKASHSKSWFKLLNRNFISNVTVVIVDGWDIMDSTFISDQDEPPREKKKKKVSEEASLNLTGGSDLYQTAEGGFTLLDRVQESLPYSSTCFPFKFEVTPPTEEPVVELFSSIPMTVNIIKSLKEKYKSLRRAANFNVVFPIKCEEPLKIKEKFTPMVENHVDQFSRLHLLLSLQEMAKFHYPLGLKGTLSGEDRRFVPLHSQYEEVTPNSPMYGIDCEMCRTKSGSELTRISVVDEKLKVVYSSFVKPGNAIENYLTMFSGITPEHLRDVTTSVFEVQQKLRQILPKDCILVGHSIENDLVALKLLHPYIIDTSHIYNISNNVYRKASLKMLTKMFLNQEIQSGGVRGHDPSEDAAATIELVLLKLRKSISFGDICRSGKFNNSKLAFYKALKARNNDQVTGFYSSKSIFGENYGSNVPKIIKLEVHNKSISFTNCEETLSNFKSYGMDDAQLTCHFSEALEIQLEAKTDFKLIVRHCQVQDTLSSGKSRKRLRKNLCLIDEKLKRLHDALPENSLILALFTKTMCYEGQKDFLLLDLKGANI